MVTNELRYLFCARHRLTINRNDPIPDAQSRFGSGGVRHHLSYDDWDVAIVGEKIEEACCLAVFGVRRRFDSQLKSLPVPLNLEWHRLTRRK